MRMSSARAAEASRTAPPRLQRQASVLHEIQETQEKENLETRYTRLMSELAAVCEDRNQVLTPESLEYLASVGRPEPIKLEREPEKVAEITEKGGKHDDLLSADAARRQRVEELTRFFMEAKSDIEFALGGREFREGRDKDRDGESEREEERGNETGDDDDDAVKGDETGDPATDAAILHHRLLKDKIDERVYNVMLSQLREQDAALYGAILCHPLVTGVDAKKDRRTKKKRKDRERKDKSQASSPVSSMLSPDFSSPALSDDEMKQNISRFVARAIADKSLQGLLLASKLILSWLLQPAHVDNGALELPVASHLRVLRGEKAPEFPKPSVTVTSAREVNLSASTIQDDRLSEANIVSESGATMDVDELHVVSEVGLPSTMDVDNEGEASITARDQLTRFGEVGVDRDSGDEEDGADIDGAESADDEGVDEDALMARAIALSLSPEMNQAGGDQQKTEDRGAEASTPLLDATPPRPKAFSPDEITALAPFLLPNDTARTSAVTVALCLLAEVNKMCLEYLESCQRGLLPANSTVQPHPLTFMLISSVSHDLLGANPAWLSNQESAVAWRLFKSCSMFSVMRALEAHLFHVEVIGMSPASVGLGQFASPGVGDQPELSNKLVGNLKNLVERCIEIDVDGREVGAEKDPIGSIVFARKWSPVDVEDSAKLYEAQVRESGLASWVRSIIHFYPSQSSRHELLMSKLQDCLSVQVGKELKSKRKFHELDLLCARLSLPDLAQQFIPPSGDVVMSGSEDKTQDNAPSTEQEASLVDDSAVHAATHKPGSSKMMWKPDSIRRSLEAGSLSTRCLFDYIVENGSPEVDGTDLTSSVLTDARVFDILTGAYTALQTASKKEEQRALECVQKIPQIVDLLRESVLRGSWPNFSFTEDYTLVHAPLSPLLEGHAKEKIPALNPRIMLLRAIQDFMIQRISGSRGDEPPALEFDPTRCAETMTLSDGHKTARQYTPKQWGMVMATTGCPPNSGTHEWAVRLDRCEKGHIFLGVCTRDASVATYVGGDRQGWGLIGTRALWHNRSKVRGDYGDGFSTSSIVRVRLNTDTGALSFGVDDSDWGIAFDGLTQHGTLYPAIGLYQRDDQVTILPVRSSESLSTVQSGGSLGIRDVTVPAILHPLLHHSAAVLEASCHFLAGEALRSAIKQAEASKSANAVKLLIDSHPLLYPLVVPLISGLSVAKRYHGLSSVLALQFIPWCTRLAQLLDSVNDSVRKISSHSSPNLSLDMSGEWELKSMAAGNIPAQQYRLSLTQEPDGAVSGRSSGSFTTVTLTGAVIGTKVRFVETWRQGGTCLVEGRLRADGNSFSGCYEDAKSHTSGNIVGHKVKGNGEGELSYLGNDGLLVLEVICANLIGYFSRSLIDCSKPDLIIDTFSTLPASEEEIVADGPSSVDADGTAKLATECSGDEYEGWVNSLLLSGGLPSAVVTAHLGDVVARLATLSQNSMTIPQLSQASDEWFQFVSPKAAKIGDRDSPVLNGSSNDFLQDLINTRGSAVIIDRWVSRHVGESPFLRLGGEPMKVAKRTVCAAMIWHSGFLTSVKKIAEATPVELIDSEQRPHENLMHIWRAAQRVIEWGIRAKNSMGSSYAVIAALVIRKAQFLLGIEPSSKAVAASVAVSALGHDGHANTASTKSAVYECAERIYSEVLMQVSRFLEAPIRISSLQSRMLAHSTKAFLRVIGMMSFRYFAGDASGGRGALSSTVHSSFALSTLIQWLSSSAVEHPGVITVVKETTDGSETNLSGSTTDSNHYLSGLGGCGKYLKNDLHDAFEALYSYLSASLSKATWAHDVDLQLVILEAWGIIIQPDDHAFLSRVGVFRVLQTVLDEARSADTTNDVMNPEERTRSQDSRRRVVQATLKVVHLLAAQVAQAGEVADSLIISPTETTSSGQLGMSAIPLLRKPSGPETLGKSVFHMLYTELKNALEELREGNSVSNKSEQLSEQPTEPTEAEPNNGGQAASALDDDVEEYCYQICSLLYSVSGSPVCRSHLSSSRWLRLLLLLLQVDAVQIQRRTLKLLRRLLPELDPTTVKLSPSSVDGFDADSDDDDEIEDADDHAASLIRFFMKIIGTICPPSLAEVMLRKLTGDGGIGNQDSGNTEVGTYTNSLAGEVVLLLRSLYKSPKWATHLALAVVSSLSSLPTKCVTEGLHHGAPADSDVEMEDTSRDMPSIEAWKSQNASYLDALSALCIIDGHTEGLHVGGTVKILPKSSSSSQEISLRGARGIVISYEPEKAAAEVLIRGSRGSDSAQQVTSSSSSSRPIRIPVDDLLPVPEVELDTSAFADEVLSAVLVEKFTFFVDEIKKSLDDLKATDLLKADDGNGGIDDDDDMSNDGSSTPSAMDSEMAISGGAESDVDSDPGSPHPASNVENQSESADVHSEMEKESKLHRMLLCQHGMRATALLLRDERAATAFIRNGGSHSLRELLKIATSETPTAGLGEIGSLEESWMFLWARWFSMRQASAYPTPDVSSKSSSGAESAADDAPNASVQQMMEMGFPKEWCEVALARCSQNVEAAINFCFEHSNDMERLVTQHKGSRESAKEGSGSRSRKPDAEAVNPLLEQLAEMGFPLNWCKKALVANRNNVDAALTWILSNGEALEAEDRRDEEAKQRSATDSGVPEPVASPAIVKPNPLRAVSGQASIGETDMMVEGLVGGGFASVGAPDCLVSSGRWYYEATLHTNGCIQIGWADIAFCGAADRGDGVGDGAHSWAYDGWRQQKWHGQSSSWGSKWKQGDVIGCSIDVDAGTIIFSLNGKMKSANMGVAFRGIKFAHGVYPCASFNRRERLQFNLGGSQFKYQAPPGFRPIIEVLCSGSESVSDLPTGFGVLGRREDCLEEAIGEENYVSDARYFGRDLHASMTRSSGSHSRSANLIGSSRADMLAELKAIPDDRLYLELLVLTRSLAILHARRALLTLLAKWPGANVGDFSIEVFLPAQTSADAAAACETTTAQFIDFVKLVGGLSNSAMGVSQSRSAEVDELLDHGACGRQGLSLILDVARSALDRSLVASPSISPVHQASFVRVFVARISNEVKLASQRQYARVPWDSGDVSVTASLVQISSESGQAWSDSEVVKHPNLFLVEWMSRLLMDSLSRYHGQLEADNHHQLRTELLKAWLAALKSPGMCVKEKAFVIISGILQDMLLMSSSKGDIESSDMKNLIERVLEALSLPRLVDLAEERLLKEYSQLPICSRYVQSVVELVAAGSLATNLIGQSTDALFFRDVTKSLAASTQLENDMFAIDAKEYEDAQERKRQLAEEAEIRAKEAAIAKQEEQSAAEETADEQMQDDGAAPTQPESNNDINDTNMDVDSDNEDTSDITLSAIANMVAEDSDVVAAAAAIAAASKGHLIIKDPSETSNPEGKPVPGDFEYTFPDEKIVFDTSMLDSREIEMLEAGSRGILGDESLQWHYGSELGIMSDTKTSIWSGQVTQFKLPTGNSEVNIPELSVGCKVIRGPNWKWRDQDGGEGSIGTVEGVSPWSGVEGEGMSVRWPNDSLYTYRWGADGNYDLIHVEVSEEGLITKHYPTPKTKSDDEGTFGCELHLGVLIHLFEDSRVWKDGARKVNGVMEWPDFGAAVLISGVQYPDSTLCIQEIQMTRGNPDMGWFLRFGTEAWQPGTKYILRPVMSESNSELVGSTLQGEYSHMARRNGSLVEMRGEVRVSTKHLFTMDPYNHFSTLAISDGGMTVTCNSGETRNLSLGTVGFATGVHYWEVRVDQAEFGSVFIGVCEKAGPPGSQAALSSRLNRWHGWGFVNFRATYHNSTERIYGDHFNAGDTIGVRLDMEQGKLSFFMDGMKFGEHIVADLGVAFDNLKGERNSRTLYPCIGMRKSGDRVALNGKWVSLPGVSPRQLLRDAIDVSSSLHSWYLSLHAPKPTPVKISESLLREAWREWKRWSENRWQRYPVRPRGVLVDFDTYPSSCIEVSKQAGLAAPFLTGDRVRICAKYGRELNQPEEAVVLGVYRGYLWYRTETQGNEGADEGRSWAWYFTPDELSELLLVKRNGKDMTLIENSATDLTESMASEVAFTPQSDAEAQAHSSFEAFANLATSSHTPFTDMQFVDRLNTFCAAIGVDVTNLKIGDVTVPIEEIEKSPTPLKRSRTHSFIPDGYFSAPLLKAITGPELRARCALLRVLNGKISRALPMIALQPTEPTIDVIEVAKSANLLGGQKSAEYPSSSLKLRSLRRLVFTSTKRAFWDAVLRSTTTNTPLPSDEYEDPREIRVIRINRIQAQPSKLSLLAQPSDRLRRSVFGQLYREMRTWNDSSFRRAYCGKGHGGQRRAFKVKFLGEGVNDYGGPYRAVFEQVVDELQMDNVELSKGEQGLLPLLIPCPNRRSGTGSNQDKFLLNPSCGTSLQSSGPMALDLHRFLGKIIGTGVRHGLQMGLDLPSLVWRPLAGLDVNRAHLESVDVVAANNLTRAEECSQENAHDILDYLNFTITLSDGSEVPLCQSGDALQVSLENRALYIRLAETTRLTESAQQLAALRDGLAAVLPMELAPLFTPRELEVLICGRREVDVDLLQQCTEYGEGIDESMPHVEAFWEVLKEMSSDERTSFLRFVWARSRMPNSAKDFPMNFKIQTAHDSGAQVDPDKYLPHAQTCFFALRLPNYTSKDILRDKLLYAIQNSPNMDADVRLHNAEGWADA